MTKLIQEGPLKGFPLDTWRFLTGDASRLDHGATYVRMSESWIECRELRNMHEWIGSDAITAYGTTDSYICADDLTNDEWVKDALKYCGLTPEECPVDTVEGVCWRIGAVVSYGLCQTDSDRGDNARKLLGFNPWCPQL